MCKEVKKELSMTICSLTNYLVSSSTMPDRRRQRHQRTRQDAGGKLRIQLNLFCEYADMF